MAHGRLLGQVAVDDDHVAHVSSPCSLLRLAELLLLIRHVRNCVWLPLRSLVTHTARGYAQFRGLVLAAIGVLVRHRRLVGALATRRLHALVHRELGGLLGQCGVSRGVETSLTLSFGSNTTSHGLRNFMRPKSGVVLASRLSIALNRDGVGLNFADVKRAVSIRNALHHRRLHSSHLASIHVITQLIFEVKVTEVCRWAVGSWTRGAETRVAAPLRAFFGRGHIFRHR